jgi:hypothetical protein
VGWEKRKKAVWKFGTGNRKCRWRARVYPEQATYPLKFAKAGSAATLPQQEKNNTSDVQRGRVNIAVFM